jgi:peptide/nickel transport system permease protein
VLRFIAARARQAAIVAFIVTSLTFVLIHVAPGDPFASVDADPATTAARALLRERYGLDRPLWQQYPVMVLALARGEFGTSYASHRPVRELLADVFPDTLALMVPALALGIVGGVLLGTWQGARAGRMGDRLAGTVTFGVLAVPEFLIALLVSTIFAVRLRWFPATGMLSVGATHDSWIAAVADAVRHAALPVATLALLVACVVARFQRAAIVEALAEGFARGARARGASRRRVLLAHALRRTAPSLFTLVGLFVPTLVGGAAMVEYVFGWPGAGQALLNAVTGRDYPVVIALVTVGSVAVSVGSALADAAAALANPATTLEA